MYTSCHPKHTKNNIPFNLARRICTIVSEENTVQQRLSELRQFLINRKYPLNLITKGIDKAKSLTKVELRNQQRSPKNKDVIPFVSTFNPKNPEIFTMIHSSLPILKTDIRMNKILQQKQIIKSKRQSKNLKKLLTRAKYEQSNKDEPSIKKCGKNNCGTCEYLLEGQTFEFKNKMQFTIKYSLDCSCENIIYARVKFMLLHAPAAVKTILDNLQIYEKESLYTNSKLDKLNMK